MSAAIPVTSSTTTSGTEFSIQYGDSTSRSTPGEKPATYSSAILRTPDESRAAAYDALVADLKVVAHALA